MNSVEEFLEHLSEKPWSDYTKADYSIEQWHSACLIHLHTGPPTSKDQCKIPVKTPAGVLNRNGVHAAAAALAGARGGVNAPSDKISAAKTAVKRFYGTMNEKPPPSMAQSVIVEDFLDHHGVKGQKWGIRRRRSQRITAGEHQTAQQLKKKHPSELTNQQLQSLNTRGNLVRTHRRLNPSTVDKGRIYVKAGVGTAMGAATVYNLYNSPAGKAAIEAGKKFMVKK